MKTKSSAVISSVIFTVSALHIALIAILCHLNPPIPIPDQVQAVTMTVDLQTEPLPELQPEIAKVEVETTPSQPDQEPEIKPEIESDPEQENELAPLNEPEIVQEPDEVIEPDFVQEAEPPPPPKETDTVQELAPPPVIEKPAEPKRTIKAIPRAKSIVKQKPTLQPITQPPFAMKPPVAAPARPSLPKTPVSREDAVVLQRTQPSYPAISIRRGEKGNVELFVVVKADGSAGDISLKTSSGFPRLDRSAMDAVQKWRFKPYQIGNRKVDHKYVLVVTFNLIK